MLYPIELRVRRGWWSDCTGSVPGWGRPLRQKARIQPAGSGEPGGLRVVRGSDPAERDGRTGWCFPGPATSFPTDVGAGEWSGLRVPGRMPPVPTPVEVRRSWSRHPFDTSAGVRPSPLSGSAGTRVRRGRRGRPSRAGTPRGCRIGRAWAACPGRGSTGGAPADIGTGLGVRRCASVPREPTEIMQPGAGFGIRPRRGVALPPAIPFCRPRRRRGSPRRRQTTCPPPDDLPARRPGRRGITIRCRWARANRGRRPGVDDDGLDGALLEARPPRYDVLGRGLRLGRQVRRRPDG